MEKIKVEKDSVEESYRWAYGWRVVDGKCSHFIDLSVLLFESINSKQNEFFSVNLLCKSLCLCGKLTLHNQKA